MAQGGGAGWRGAAQGGAGGGAGTARLSDQLLYRLPYQLSDQLSYGQAASGLAILGQAAIRRAVFKAVSGEAGANSCITPQEDSTKEMWRKVELWLAMQPGW